MLHGTGRTRPSGARARTAACRRSGGKNVSRGVKVATGVVRGVFGFRVAREDVVDVGVGGVAGVEVCGVVEMAAGEGAEEDKSERLENVHSRWRCGNGWTMADNELGMLLVLGNCWLDEVDVLRCSLVRMSPAFIATVHLPFDNKGPRWLCHGSTAELLF